MSSALKTKKFEVKQVRSAVASADADLGVTERTYAYFTANLAGKAFIPTPEESLKHDQKEGFDNQVEFMFSFNDNAGTATVIIYAMRYAESTANSLYTAIEPVCTFTLEAGTMTTGEGTARYWADTAVLTDYWGSTAVVNSTSGGNGQVKVSLDGRGRYAFIPLITVISAEDNVSCYASCY